MQMKPLDAMFPIQQQLGEKASPVVLVNLFTLDGADESAFLNAWTQDAIFMKAQRGFISTQLHRAVGANPTYFNTAVWESVAQQSASTRRANSCTSLAAGRKQWTQ